MKTVSERQSRVVIRLGKQRYALDVTRQASVLPPEPATRLIETKFLRLRKPMALGKCIGGWRVCWVGGWDSGKEFFVAMVSRGLYVTNLKWPFRRLPYSVSSSNSLKTICGLPSLPIFG
jgi:hypothetical protein